MAANYTPMVQQYLEVKRQHQDELLFFRLGDFYEMFFDDALTASRELNITLTGRAAGLEERIPMCGRAQGYKNYYAGHGFKRAAFGRQA